MSFKTRPSAYNSSVTIYEPGDIEAPSTSAPLEASPESSRRTKRIKREHDTEASASSTPEPMSRKRQRADASAPRKVVRAISPKKPKPIPQALASPHPAPENWREVYDTIKEMRSRIAAPVDTMGCDQAQRGESDPKVRPCHPLSHESRTHSVKNRRFSTLVSLMLSSQTKDEVTDAAVIKLRAAVGGTLSIDAVIATEESVIAEAINKVGFWRRKSG